MSSGGYGFTLKHSEEKFESKLSCYLMPMKINISLFRLKSTGVFLMNKSTNENSSEEYLKGWNNR
jgi:hypothetical protein